MKRSREKYLTVAVYGRKSELMLDSSYNKDGRTSRAVLVMSQLQLELHCPEGKLVSHQQTHRPESTMNNTKENT